MRFDVQIPDSNGFLHCFKFSFRFSNFERIVVEDVCIIDVFKVHNHRYDMKCFFYLTKHIYCYDCLNSKRKLLYVIQELLEENLHVDVQIASG